jgi:hypothetical protein
LAKNTLPHIPETHDRGRIDRSMAALQSLPALAALDPQLQERHRDVKQSMAWSEKGQRCLSAASVPLSARNTFHSK